MQWLDLEGKITISTLPRQDLLWWISDVDQYLKAISPLPPYFTLMRQVTERLERGDRGYTKSDWWQMVIPGIQVPH